MSDSLGQALLSPGGRYAQLSPETLEQLGKKAANLYLDKGVALNESIAKLAGAYEDISAEQIKRIVGFANTATYLGLHEKNKTAGAAHSYPQFRLADANAVLGDLSDGARPTVLTKTDVDYGKQPEKKTKISSAESDRLFDEALGIRHEKIASTTAEGVADRLLILKKDLVGLKDHLSHAADVLHIKCAEAREEYYTEVKRHLLEGNSFADVVAAARSTGAPAQKVASNLQPIIGRLLKEKVATARELRESAKGIDKIAHRIVNEQHPLVVSFGAIVGFSDEIDKLAVALDDVDVQITRVKDTIREAFIARKAC
jgi:hypothetical protein